MSTPSLYYIQTLLRNLTLVCSSMLGLMMLACCNKKKGTIGLMSPFTTINQPHIAPPLDGAADHMATKPLHQKTFQE